VFLAKTGIVLGPEDDAACAFVVAVATALLTTGRGSRSFAACPSEWAHFDGAGAVR
jgi:hypothetical protein